jgi:hypothetical protein
MAIFHRAHTSAAAPCSSYRTAWYCCRNRPPRPPSLASGAARHPCQASSPVGQRSYRLHFTFFTFLHFTFFSLKKSWWREAETDEEREASFPAKDFLRTMAVRPQIVATLAVLLIAVVLPGKLIISILLSIPFLCEALPQATRVLGARPHAGNWS